jgi:protein-disulfide isomerase
LTKREGLRIALGFCAGLAVAAAVILMYGRTKGSNVEAAGAPPSSDQVIHYIRERFGVPDSENLSLLPFQASPFPGYYRTTVTASSGTNKRTSTISVSADGHYLILSDFMPLGPNPKAGIVQQLTKVFKIPANVKLAVGPFTPSPVPNFFETLVTARGEGKVNSQKYFVTRDKRFVVLGGIFNMEVDPRREALKTIKLADQPSEGPADAPVTIVEYADMECPTCAREHQFLQQQVVPRYGKKVRLVFKEFPLVQIHAWAYTAALAAQCAYQIDPSKYVAFRGRVFENQTNITATDARDLLLYYGEQVGLDRLKLAACIDSKASLPRVEEDLREAQELGVDRTPTFFINGRKVIGGGTPEAFFQSIDEALRAATRR